MSLLRQVRYGIRALFNRASGDAEIAEEVTHYVEELTQLYMSRGLDRPAARRAALLEAGGATQTTEQVRSYGWENVIETAGSDIRFGMRRLAAAPGFTVVALLTLALGIGGTTAIFSAVNPILFKSLPYPHADRITMIREQRPDGSSTDGTFGMYLRMQSQTRAFEYMAAYKAWQPTLTGLDQAERFTGQRVSFNYFRVLGVDPEIGRSFSSDDDRAQGPLVVVLSDQLWHRRFSGDPRIIGRSIRLNEQNYTVVGVMPPGFRNVLSPSSEIWAPLQYDITEGRAWGHHLQTVGRMRRGTSSDAAAAELNRIGMAVLQKEKPETYGASVKWSAPQLQSDLTRGVRPALLAVLVAMVLVLAIACVNVSNLLLARGVQRRGEFALRAALGAGRRRLIRQLLTESILLCSIAGVLGMIVAMLGIRVLVHLSPPGLPLVDEVRLDRYAFVFGAGVTTLIGVVFGLIPAMQSAGNEHRDLQSVSKRVAGKRHKRVRSLLVITEVALALVLLTGSGLLLRSMQRLFAIPPGFRAENIVTLQVQAVGNRFASDEAALRFFSDVLESVRHINGVESAALTSQLPLSGDFDVYGVHFETGAQKMKKGEDHGSFRYAVSPGYLETMAIPLRSGRTLLETDRASAPLVALINESFARRNFGTTNPLGQRLRIGAETSEPFTIVGVVADVKQMSLTLDDNNAVYTTQAQATWGDRAMTIVVHSKRDPATLVPEIRNALLSIDKDQPVTRVATMTELLSATAAERRFALILFEAFALAALVLAAAGIYGVLAGSVAERTREIGVRTALGAEPRSIVALIMGEGFNLTLLGIIAGLVFAVASSRLISALLFNVSSVDPLTYAGVIALLGFVSMTACAIPALRAARVDAVNTLRGD